jgi:hypothetical protein
MMPGVVSSLLSASAALLCFFFAWFAKAYFIKANVYITQSGNPYLHADRWYSKKQISTALLFFKKRGDLMFSTCSIPSCHSCKADCSVEQITKNRENKSISKAALPESIETFGPLIYVGQGWLPKKIYEGDSKNISFTFSQKPYCRVAQIRSRSKYDEMKDIDVPIEISPKRNVLLEMKMLAAAVDISGEPIQQVKLSNGSIHFQWNCHFKNSGIHQMAFLLRCIVDSQEVFTDRFEHTVKVVRLDHLTQRQVWAFATFAGLLSGAIGLAEIINRIGLW